MWFSPRCQQLIELLCRQLGRLICEVGMLVTKACDKYVATKNASFQQGCLLQSIQNSSCHKVCFLPLMLWNSQSIMHKSLRQFLLGHLFQFKLCLSLESLTRPQWQQHVHQCSQTQITVKDDLCMAVLRGHHCCRLSLCHLTPQRQRHDSNALTNRLGISAYRCRVACCITSLLNPLS